jgi:hypothetical protein
MANTPTPEPMLTLDREDPETLAQSTNKQWELIAHLLHLPPIHTIENANQRVMAQRIARYISDVRGGIVDQILLGNELHDSFQERLRNVRGIDAEREPVRAATTRENVAIAEAWLQTIYTHFGQAELRTMIQDLPASIIPISGNDRWQTTDLIDLGTPPTTFGQVSINLASPIWSTGNRQVISARLLGRTFAQAGILTNPPIAGNQVIAQTDLDPIFGLTCEVVDPLLSIAQVSLDNHPVARHRVVVDLAPLIRRNPNLTTLNAADMAAALIAVGNRALFNRHCTHIDMQTGAQLLPITDAQIPGVVNAIFQNQHRDADVAFGSQTVTLAAAIQNRQPIERLVAGSATNRELLLALSMIQRDPSTAAILEDPNNATDEIRNRLTRNENLLRTAQTIKDIQTVQLPSMSEADIAESQQALQLVTISANGGLSAAHGTPVLIWDNTTLTTPVRQAAARRAGIPQAIQRVEIQQVVNLNGVVTTPERNNANLYQSIVEKAQQNLTQLEEAQNRVNTIAQLLNTMLAQLNTNSITEAQIAGPEYAYLRQFLMPALPAPQVYAVQRTQINATVNTAELARQFTRALREANPGNRIALRDVSFYEQQQQSIIAELTTAENIAPTATQVGSEACRAIVERGLSHEGLRDAELNDTANYMFNSIQRTGESVQDLQMYAQREFPDGEGNHDAEHHWEHGKSFRRFRTLGATHSTPYNDYLRNLSTPNNLGFDLRDNHGNNAPFEFRQYPLSRLIEVHFRTKHLTELPESDPHRLPKSERVVEFQRELYQHIVDRAQKSFQRASGMSNQDLDDLRARGLGIDVSQLSTLSIQERMNAARDFLRNSSAYMGDATNKSNFDRMVHRAYHPIQEEIERHNVVRARWNIINPVRPLSWNPVTWPLGLPVAVGRAGINGVKAAGNVYRENSRLTLVAGTLGFFAIPGYGLPLFGAGVPMAYHLYKKLTGGAAGGHAIHDPHAADAGHGH